MICILTLPRNHHAHPDTTPEQLDLEYFPVTMCCSQAYWKKIQEIEEVTGRMLFGELTAGILNKDRGPILLYTTPALSVCILRLNT